MKILILFGVWAALNVLILRLIHIGKKRQREMENVRFRKLSQLDKEAEWRVR